MANQSILLRDETTGEVLGGEYPVAPIFYLQPTAQRVTPVQNAGWSRRRRYEVYNGETEALRNFAYALDLGDTTSLVSGGKALASGDDVRVWKDGIEIPRQLVDWNDATFDTLCWVIIDFLQPGDTALFEVVYGNSLATDPPTFTPFFEEPGFDISTEGANRSSNAKWVNPTTEVAANAGKGAWPLNSTTIQPTANFHAPGAWHPEAINSLPDDKSQDTYTAYEDTLTYYHSIFKARRAREGSTIVQRDLLGADGVAIHSPVQIESVRCNFKFTNMLVSESDATPIGKLAIMGSKAQYRDWYPIFEYAEVAETEVSIATATYTCPSGTKDVAFAVLPYDGLSISGAARSDRYVEASWDTVMELNLDDSRVTQTLVEAEVEIYELADEIRYGGGGEVEPVGGYQAIRLGNYLEAAGRGSPRMACKLNEQVAVDNQRRTVEIWNSALTAKVEDAPVQAYSAVEAVYRGNGDPPYAQEDWVEQLDPDWIYIVPVVNPLLNPSFDDGLTNWTSGSPTAGLTASYDTDEVDFDSSPAALVWEATANAVASSGVQELITTLDFPVGDRKSLQVGWSVMTEHLDMHSEIRIIWRDESGTLIGGPSFGNYDLAAIDTWERKLWANLIPEGVVTIELRIRSEVQASGVIGKLWTDTIEIDGPEICVFDVNLNPGTLGLTYKVKARYAYA